MLSCRHLPCSSDIIRSHSANLPTSFFIGPYSVTLNKAPLERKENVENLGVYLDEGLNWKFHIIYISKMIAELPSVIFRTYRCFDTSSKEIIFSSLI